MSRGHPNYKTDCKVDFCSENKELNWIKIDLFTRNRCNNILGASSKIRFQNANMLIWEFRPISPGEGFLICHPKSS